jgi:hypothetical protein
VLVIVTGDWYVTGGFPMAMTAAERQARYREARKAEKKVRREFMLPPAAVDALASLAEHWECTDAEALERALSQAARRVTR